jgi:hypothetical protein
MCVYTGVGVWCLVLRIYGLGFTVEGLDTRALGFSVYYLSSKALGFWYQGVEV